MDRTAHLLPLGSQRLRALECLGGSSPQAPGYFAPTADVDIFEAFRRHVGQLSQKWAAETDPMTVSLLAAGRLLCGDLAAADIILDHLPAEAIKRDHGAGSCLVLPVHALATALPLPTALADTRRWLAGSAEQAAVRAWLHEHRDALHWIEADGVYRSGT